jgi:hypothetical protein
VPEAQDNDVAVEVVHLVNQPAGLKNDFPDRRFAKFRNDATPLGKLRQAPGACQQSTAKLSAAL